MKIGYIDHYVKGQSPHKDPLTIPTALRQLGCEITLIACNAQPQGRMQLHGFDIQSLFEVEASGWGSFGFEGIIFASRLDSKFTPTVRNIHKSGLNLIIKSDSDGTWGYPLPPNYLRARPILGSPINFLRHLKWKLPFKHSIASKIDQLKLAEFVVVESPGAAVNATSVLLHWGRDDLAKKVRFIPNPISSEALDIPVSSKKNNRIIAVGRWDDRGVKNTQTMLRTAAKFLAVNMEFDFEIIGSGLDVIEAERYLGESIESGRLRIIPEMPYKELQERLGQAKILLVPSTLESFCFVALEALCAGSSIVVTPIESLNYLAGGGRWGSVARSFDQERILAALIYEVQAWESGLRNSKDMSDFARKEFHPHLVASKYIALFR